MDNHRLEKHIKDQLADHKVSINKDDLWNGIQKKKRRNGLTWFLLPGIAFVFFIGYFSMVSLDGNNNFLLSSNEVVEQNTSVENKIAPSKINSERIASSDLSTSNSENNKIKEDDKTKLKDLNRKEYNSSKIHEVNDIGVIESKVSNKHRNFKTNLDPPISNTIATTNTRSYRNIVFFENKILNTNLNNLIPKENNVEKASNILREENKIENELLEKNSASISYTFLSLKEIPLFSIASKESNFSDKIKDGTFLKANKIKGKSKSHFFTVSLFYTYSQVEKSLSSSSNLELLRFRKASETALENVSYGCEILYELPKGFYLKSGIQYQRLQENLKRFEIRSEEIKLVPGTIENINYADGTVEEIPGMIEEIHTKTRNYNVYNSFNRWDIPVGIGYHKRLKNFSIEGDLNMSFNLKSSFTGYTYNDELKLEQGLDKFKSNLKPQGFASIGMGYHFSNRLSLFIKPQIQFKAWDVSAADNPIQQTYKLRGLTAAVRCNLK